MQDKGQKTNQLPSNFFSEDLYCDFIKVFGQDIYKAWKEKLLIKINKLQTISADDATRLKLIAHELVSYSGTLGFIHTSQACRSLETAIGKQMDYSTHLQEARESAHLARLFAIENLDS